MDVRRRNALPRACLLACVALLAAPAGCDRASASKTGAAAVVARVNGVEISANDVSGAQALEKVIDWELLAQKALAAGLDRDPAVRQSMENNRRHLLAQAYLERAAAGIPSSTPEEVHRFYADNPALFSERRIYRLRELAVPAPAELIDVLREEALRSADLERTAAWLRERNARFDVLDVMQPAEEVALSRLPKLARMKPGEVAVFASPGGASVVQLVRADEAPLTEQQAAPVIERFLAGRKRMEAAAAEVGKLRASARIEYAANIKQ